MTYSPPSWRTVAEFWVAGEPAPGGSKTFMPFRRRGQPIIKNGRVLVDFVTWHNADNSKSFTTSFFDRNGELKHEGVRAAMGITNVSQCYSTRAAAESALSTPTRGGEGEQDA